MGSLAIQSVVCPYAFFALYFSFIISQINWINKTELGRCMDGGKVDVCVRALSKQTLTQKIAKMVFGGIGFFFTIHLSHSCHQKPLLFHCLD